MTTASPAACQRVNSRRQPPTLPSSYTTRGDTTRRDLVADFGGGGGRVPRYEPAILGSSRDHAPAVGLSGGFEARL